MTLIDKGYALLTRLAGSSAGVAIRYEHWKRNENGESALQGWNDITAESGDAIVGRTVFASNRQDGARIEFGERDYLIKASALFYGEPKEGDRIIQEFSAKDGQSFGKRITYEVLPPSTGEPAERWSDPQRVRYRVHVKLVKCEE